MKYAYKTFEANGRTFNVGEVVPEAYANTNAGKKYAQEKGYTEPVDAEEERVGLTTADLNPPAVETEEPVEAPKATDTQSKDSEKQVEAEEEVTEEVEEEPAPKEEAPNTKLQGLFGKKNKKTGEAAKK